MFLHPGRVASGSISLPLAPFAVFLFCPCKGIPIYSSQARIGCAGETDADPVGARTDVKASGVSMVHE
jgi:hypothetical protein